jgi:hypothetical protein
MGRKAKHPSKRKSCRLALRFVPSVWRDIAAAARFDKKDPCAWAEENLAVVAGAVIVLAEGKKP